MELASASPVGSLLLSGLLPFSLVHLGLIGYAPVTKSKIRKSLMPQNPRPRTVLEVLDVESRRAAELLHKTFSAVGVSSNFAPIVLVLGHGASSRNNPYSSAYNCGACCGNEGGPNARLFAQLANDPTVRDALRSEFSVDIPGDSVRSRCISS